MSTSRRPIIRQAADPFIHPQRSLFIRGGQKLTAVGLLGKDVQNFRAFGGADEKGVNGHPQRFGQLAFLAHQPIPLGGFPIGEKQYVLVAGAAPPHFLQGVAQGILIIGHAGAGHIGCLFDDLVVIAGEKPPIVVVLPRDVIEFDISDPHSFAAHQVHQTGDDGRGPAGIAAFHGLADIADDHHFAAHVLFFPPEGPGQVRGDRVGPDGRVHGVAVQKFLEGGHVLIGARRAARMHFHIGLIAFQPPSNLVQQHLKIFDRLGRIALGIGQPVLAAAGLLLHGLAFLRLLPFAFDGLHDLIHHVVVPAPFGLLGILSGLSGLFLSLGPLKFIPLLWHLLFFLLGFLDHLFQDFVQVFINGLGHAEGEDVLEHSQIGGFRHFPALQQGHRLDHAGHLDQHGTVGEQ